MNSRPFVLLIFILLLTIAVSAEDGAQIAARRVQHLRRGINTSHWFSQAGDVKNYTPEHLNTWTTPQDIALIKSMGFDHIRFSINPVPVYQGDHPDELRPEYLALIEQAMNTMLSNGLAVIVDIHPESDFKHRVNTEPGFDVKFADFWRAFAAHLSKFDPERVFFEVENEPETDNGYLWGGIQASVAAAIRQSAPNHTIIVAGHRYSDADELLVLQPLADRNVIYNFHYYTPHQFTHQGAGWSSNIVHYLEHGVPYPSSPADADKLQAQVPTELDKLEITRYAYDRWDAQRIAMEIGFAADWAKRNNVVLTCNEFGVYRKYADPQQRATWLRDVRNTLEKHGIGWTMWDYAGGFGVANGDPGHRTPDDVTLRALGLK